MSTPTGPNDPDRNDPDRNDPDRPATPDDAGNEPPRYGDQPQYGQSAPQYGQAPPPPPEYGQDQYGQDQYGQNQYGQGTQHAAGSYGAGTGYSTPSGYERQPSNGLGIAALVFGVLALLFCWIPYVNIVSMVLGIIGIVVGILALRKVKRGEATNRGMSLTGLALSAVALVLSLVITIAVTAFIGQNIGELSNCTDPSLSAEEQQACIEDLGNS